MWLPLQATAGLADGRTYLGNLDLDSEVAHEVELGFDFVGSRVRLAPRVFYREVDDYISGTALSGGPRRHVRTDDEHDEWHQQSAAAAVRQCRCQLLRRRPWIGVCNSMSSYQ